MELEIADRIFHAKGKSAYELGANLGSVLGPHLAKSIQQYFLARLPEKLPQADSGFQERAMDHLNRFPERFLDELRGLSVGSGVPLSRLRGMDVSGPLSGGGLHWSDLSLQ
jgi:hypothetical protein